jgi:hypothetical protein
MEELKQRLRADRLAAFVRLKGGYPIPLAGAVYWAGLGIAGYRLGVHDWVLAAFFLSGAIFPLALLLAKIAGNPFMKDKTAAGDVLLPAFAAMLLFWPIAFAAFGSAPQLVPLILAIGMAQHWPVIGWSYGMTGLYTAHAIARAVGATAIWALLPDARFTLLPLFVAAVYLVTVAAILVAARRAGRSDQGAVGAGGL